MSNPGTTNRTDDRGPATNASRNIDEVLRMEEAEQRRSPPSSKAADLVAGFAGTLRFVLLHVVWIAAWVAVNVGVVPAIPPFDPFPFSLLGGIFSLEGVLLAAFVLMKQNRMSARDEARSHLDLQISLLAEQEITKVIQMLERISIGLDIEAEVVDAESHELGGNTAVGDIAKRLKHRLRSES